MLQHMTFSVRVEGYRQEERTTPASTTLSYQHSFALFKGFFKGCLFVCLLGLVSQYPCVVCVICYCMLYRQGDKQKYRAKIVVELKSHMF